MEWWHSLSAYRQVNSAPLAELVLGKVLGRALGFLMIVLAIAVGVRWRRSSVDSPSFLLVSTFVMAITMVVASSSVAVYDQILLLPAALWLWSERRSILRADWPLRVISLLLLAAFVWPFVTGAALAVASPVLPWARSLRAVLIPLATAASFPLIVLTLLTLLLWRRVRDGASDSVPAEAAIVVTPES
jgi:hypothetical protein